MCDYSSRAIILRDSMNSRAIQKHLPLASFGGQSFSVRLSAFVLSFSFGARVPAVSNSGRGATAPADGVWGEVFSVFASKRGVVSLLRQYFVHLQGLRRGHQGFET